MVEHVHCIVKVCKKKKQVVTDSHPQDGQESSCTKIQLVEGWARLHLNISQQLTGRHSLASRGGGTQHRVMEE